MTKRQLVKYLEKKQSEAINEAKKQFADKMCEYITARNTAMKVDEVAKQVAELISKADDIIDEWKKQIKENHGMETFNSCFGVKCRISKLLTESDVKECMKDEFKDDSKEKNSIIDRKDDVINQIKKNYIAVIANVQQLKDAKAGVVYLQELGFDLTELMEADKNPVTTALSTQIDTRYLFIN